MEMEQKFILSIAFSIFFAIISLKLIIGNIVKTQRQKAFVDLVAIILVISTLTVFTVYSFIKIFVYYTSSAINMLIVALLVCAGVYTYFILELVKYYKKWKRTSPNTED